MALAGRPLVAWSVAACARAAGVDAIVVAAPPGHEEEIEAATRPAAGEANLEVVTGGATRAESVAGALAAVGGEIVAVHDAARPLVTPRLIEALVELVALNPEIAGAIAAAPVTDTIKRATGEPAEIAATEDRSQLWSAQTPQVFRTEELRAAHRDPAATAATDDAMLVESRGGRVLIEDAGARNLKVTNPTDLRLAELLLAEARHSP